MKRPNYAKIARQVYNLLPSSDDLPKMLNSAAMLVKNEKMRSVLSAASIAYTFADTAYSQWSDARPDDSYAVVITERDPLFNFVQIQVLMAQSEEEQKFIQVSSGSSSTYDWEDELSEGGEKEKNALTITHHGSAVVEVIIAGQKVKVQVGADGAADETAARGNRSTSIMTKQMTIFCADLEARKAIVGLLNSFAVQATTRRPRFYEANKWGNFRYLRDTPVRPSSSVVLKDGQMDRIFSMLRTFLASESEYVRLGIPYRTGLLLYGNPGTGKTSVASTVAHELGLDVYNISLSTVEDDSSLMDLFQEITPRSVVLLEDVDVNHSATERDDSGHGVTMSGLLNALDGIATPHGLITIMTTNHIEDLDPALIRSGRIDVRELINEIDNYQLRMLCLEFLGTIPDDLPSITEDNGIVAADIMDVFKRNMRNMDGAGSDLVGFINSRIKENNNAEVPSALQN